MADVKAVMWFRGSLLSHNSSISFTWLLLFISITIVFHWQSLSFSHSHPLILTDLRILPHPHLPAKRISPILENGTLPNSFPSLTILRVPFYIQLAYFPPHLLRIEVYSTSFSATDLRKNCSPFRQPLTFSSLPTIHHSPTPNYPTSTWLLAPFRTSRPSPWKSLLRCPSSSMAMR